MSVGLAHPPAQFGADLIDKPLLARRITRVLRQRFPGEPCVVLEMIGKRAEMRRDGGRRTEVSDKQRVGPPACDSREAFRPRLEMPAVSPTSATPASRTK